MSEGKITLSIVAPELQAVAELPEVQAYLREVELRIERRIELQRHNLEAFGSIHGPC